MIPHLFFLLVVCGLYHLTISAVIIGVSSYGRSEQGSVALTLGVLLGLNLFLPKALPPLSELLVHENGVGELRRNLYSMLSQAPDGHRPGGAEFQKIKETLLNQYGAKELEELPINYEGVILQVAEVQSSGIFQHMFQEQWRRFLRQETVTLFLGAIAPALTQRVLAMHFSQTHLKDQLHFEERVEKHRADFVRELNQMVIGIPYADRKTKKLPASTWEQIPSFRFESLPFLSALRNAWFPLLIAAFQCFLAVRFAARRRLP
jgi:ABC-2 type transport system permease protein